MTASIRDVASFLQNLKSLGLPVMFRGQSRDWPLLPSLARLTAQVNAYANWNIFQLDLHERFVRLATPLMETKPSNSVDWLIHAQHQGVPTRLLDWTTNPLKALFWATENRSADDKDGVVWAFEPKSWREDVLQPTNLSDEDLTAFYPMHLNHRVIAQEACFVSFPLPLDCEPMRPMERPGAYPDSTLTLEKLIIPGSAKRTIRIELKVLGISHRSLFPDLFGVARQINEDLHEV